MRRAQPSGCCQLCCGNPADNTPHRPQLVCTRVATLAVLEQHCGGPKAATVSIYAGVENLPHREREWRESGVAPHDIHGQRWNNVWVQPDTHFVAS